MSYSFCAAKMRSWLGCARSKPAPPVARSLATISSLLEKRHLDLDVGVLLLEQLDHLLGRIVAPGQQPEGRLGVCRTGDRRKRERADGEISDFRQFHPLFPPCQLLSALRVAVLDHDGSLAPRRTLRRRAFHLRRYWPPGTGPFCSACRAILATRKWRAGMGSDIPAVAPAVVGDGSGEKPRIASVERPGLEGQVVEARCGPPPCPAPSGRSACRDSSPSTTPEPQ